MKRTFFYMILLLLLSQTISAQTVHDVTVADFSFTPDTLNIIVGDTVKWTCVQGTHNVLADDNSFTSGPVAPAPWVYSHKFTTASINPYHCALHGGPGGQGMSGVIIVHVASEPAPVNLGTSGNFVILAKTGISTTGTTLITGDIGVSPIDHTAITGFDLILDPSGTFSTSSLVVGKVYAADYAPPTPTMLSTAVTDMETAYTDAAGRTPPDYTELYSGDITGQTLTHGVYKWSTGVLVSAGGVTISGTASDVWIFQIAQNLTVASGAIVTLSGGAKVSNIFWQVAGQVTLGTTSDFKGIILCQTLIEMQTNGMFNGRALAQTAVTLDANMVPIEVEVAAPNTFALEQNYPNPFNPSTQLKYSIPQLSNVLIKVFDVLGNEVETLVNEEKPAGIYELNWTAANLPSGVYFYQLKAGSFFETKKMILLK